MISKQELDQRVQNRISDTKEALQLVIDELNHGQRQKITKNQKLKDLLDFYEVDYS